MSDTPYAPPDTLVFREARVTRDRDQISGSTQGAKDIFDTASAHFVRMINAGPYFTSKFLWAGLAHEDTNESMEYLTPGEMKN
ncbi:hypothetical protein B0H13DRAFT_2301296 [Mycena leptocephala]|nr:hypothetical protein B0H13DRAFT_2301296 [Mycena leptocephala]